MLMTLRFGILHTIDVMGDEHVGIGSDYNGVLPDSQIVIKNPAIMQKLWECLDKQGVNRATLEKIVHQNFFRLLE